MTTKSPPPTTKPAPKGLSFTEALNIICDDYGKKMTRVEWDDPDTYGLMQDTKLRLHMNDKYHDWILNDGDILADDWRIL